MAIGANHEYYRPAMPGESSQPPSACPRIGAQRPQQTCVLAAPPDGIVSPPTRIPRIMTVLPFRGSSRRRRGATLPRSTCRRPHPLPETVTGTQRRYLK